MAQIQKDNWRIGIQYNTIHYWSQLDRKYFILSHVVNSFIRAYVAMSREPERDFMAE